MSLPGVEPVLPSWKEGALPPRTWFYLFTAINLKEGV